MTNIYSGFHSTCIWGICEFHFKLGSHHYKYSNILSSENLWPQNSVVLRISCKRHSTYRRAPVMCSWLCGIKHRYASCLMLGLGSVGKRLWKGAWVFCGSPYYPSYDLLGVLWRLCILYTDSPHEHVLKVLFLVFEMIGSHDIGEGSLEFSIFLSASCVWRLCSCMIMLSLRRRLLLFSSKLI